MHPEAVVVIVMVAIVFAKVEDAVTLTDSRYKVRVCLSLRLAPIQPDRSSRPPRQSHVTLHFSSLPSKFIQCAVEYSMLTSELRLFEIFMAYDALRLRNVIQLVGLLCALLPQRSKCGQYSSLTPLVSLVKYSMRPSSSCPHYKCTKPTPLWSPDRELTGPWTTWYVFVVYPPCVTASHSSNSTATGQEPSGNAYFLS